MDDPLRVRRKRQNVKVNHNMRLYTDYLITDKREREREQKKKTRIIQNGENSYDILS